MLQPLHMISIGTTHYLAYELSIIRTASLHVPMYSCAAFIAGAHAMQRRNQAACLILWACVAHDLVHAAQVFAMSPAGQH